MHHKLYEYKGIVYPAYLKKGNAAKYVMPFAKEFCQGKGLDIGGTDECHFPGAGLINSDRFDGCDAYHLPDGLFDYIFSSHTLEHLSKPVEALEGWIERLKSGGVLFLYLPHPDMLYWHPSVCLKHIHTFTPVHIFSILKALGILEVLISERDLYWSFAVVGFKT